MNKRRWSVYEVRQSQREHAKNVNPVIPEKKVRARKRERKQITDTGDRDTLQVLTNSDVRHYNNVENGKKGLFFYDQKPRVGQLVLITDGERRMKAFVKGFFSGMANVKA